MGNSRRKIEMASKRQSEETTESENKRLAVSDDRLKCFFGQKCYRRNPEHFKVK